MFFFYQIEYFCYFVEFFGVDIWIMGKFKVDLEYSFNQYKVKDLEEYVSIYKRVVFF